MCVCRTLVREMKRWTRKKSYTCSILYFLLLSIPLTAGSCWCNSNQQRPHILYVKSKMCLKTANAWICFSDITHCMQNCARFKPYIYKKTLFSFKEAFRLFRMQLQLGLSALNTADSPRTQSSSVENELMPLSCCRKKKDKHLRARVWSVQVC